MKPCGIVVFIAGFDELEHWFGRDALHRHTLATRCQAFW